jgi:exopolysaccharide biosynthesis polyprenyl glycosylphosphotransferase
VEAAGARVSVPEARAADLRPAIDAQRGRSDWALRRLLGTGDAVAVLIALIVALVIPGRPDAANRVLWGLAAVPLLIVLFKVYGLYDRDVKRISYSTVDDLPLLFHATVMGGLVLWLYARFSPMHRLAFIEILLFGLSVIAFVISSRFALRTAAGRLIGRDRAVLVGGGAIAQTLIRKLSAHPEYRLDVVGSLAFPGHAASRLDYELEVLGTVDELEDVANRHRIARVLFSARDVDERELEVLLRQCRALLLKVSVLPRLSDVLGSAVEIDDVEGITVLGLNPPWLPRSSRAVKRVMDLVIAISLTLLLAPLLLFVAISVKLDSRGPVFFVQDRVGKGGRLFRVFKFRTMIADAEQRRAELLEQSTDPNWLKLEHDPRITRIGRWLRRLSLDELPQLWNVLRGEMSMVGPRPLIPAEDELVEGWARGRLDLTPGITGYWQVLGRTRIPFEEMVKLDYLYVTNWSLWEDVRLMLRTLPAVLTGRGVN